ncbi:MAG: hypothetical protein B7Y80_18220 [Hyphomicrobium sp. 32-62-53]|nr:MAG: hypothetical protein B7Z29_18345 [Hyphomicrobium sp. 12-62-95]OYX97802.1 MAG: hypothetical protein B7Y80_18220 [Hyphomicrobium sp. 32-62-53]
MLHKVVAILSLSLALLSFAFAPMSAFGQNEAVTQPTTFSTEELDQMLAPVALYPDEVLANVLMAATYPLDVVQAARWRKEAANKQLKGDELTKALEVKAWDPSVKALTLFPEVLGNMSDQIEWTQSLGDAFLAQEDEVFARVQYLRQKAEAAGNLKSNKQQTVTKQSNPETRTEYIVIQPASPQYVYVPVYQPTVVYGSWWYPSYPPYYWNYYPGATLVNGLFWGAGFAVANNIWGWNDFNWRNGNIDIDINRYNNINVNRPPITNNRWEHNAAHRGPVPYRDKATREKYGKDNQLRDKSKDFSGFDKDKLNKGPGDKSRDVESVKNKLGETSGDKFKDKTGDRDLSNAKDRAGDRGGDKVKDKAGDRNGDRAKDKSVDRPASKDVKNQAASREIQKPSPKPASKALDVKPKAQVQKHIDRGGASRAAAQSHQKARSGGGGGGDRGGGGRR